eukprot:996975-Prorocentrum_minimum.AAC.2
MSAQGRSRVSRRGRCVRSRGRSSLARRRTRSTRWTTDRGMTRIERRTAFCAEHSLFACGRCVRYSELKRLYPKVVTVTLDLGYADLRNHTLSVCLDCDQQVQEIGFPFEATYANNQETNNLRAPITFRFCGFGVDMNAGDGIKAGFQFNPWADGYMCLYDVDLESKQIKVRARRTRSRSKKP